MTARYVLRAWYASPVANRFSFTDEALANLRVYDVTPGEVWEALHSNRRVIRHLGDDVMVVYATDHRGRRLAVLLAEADGTDNDWDILSARELSDVEAKRYDEAVRNSRRRGGGHDAP
ncbi:hypothetical protein CSH63_16360 [Micromonospora tulbaghiae]|uniref:BrnT family toxin n=1 Tax=Micromonospora tulbaghiae TaxID=479978 RepID=A0A386WMH2_9ACTN|nr:hypothetical protein CSH63_16360 [Micromonospora tulbaghiae]